MFAVIAAWQVEPLTAPRRLAVLALVGIAASTALALVVRGQLDPDARAGVDSATPWLIVLIAGRVAEAGAWIALALSPARRGAIAVATGGAVASVLAGVALREAARMHLLAPIRPNAVAAGGAVAFAVVAV